MRNRLICFCLIVFISMFFSACFSAIPEMSVEEERQITQYMADLLLEYDSNYQSSFLSEQEKATALLEEASKRAKAEQIRKEEEQIKAEKEAANTPDDIEIKDNADGSSGTIENLSSYLAFDGVTFEYQGYEISSQYPVSDEEVYLSMTPTQGCDFVILKFEVSNISSGEYLVDMSSQGNYFMLEINSDIRRRALTTLFEEDLSIYHKVLAIETDEEAILIFEKPSNVVIEDMLLCIGSSQRDIYKEIPLE